MNCPKCSRELRIAPEQVGHDANNMPVYHRFGYCDTCMTKTDLDVVQTQVQQPSQVPAKEEKKHSGLSTAACICSIFGCTMPIAVILAIVDLCINDKSKKHMGSWFALIFSVICIIVLGPNLFGSADKVEKGNANTQEEISVESAEVNNENSFVKPGEYFEVEGLKVTITSADTEFTDYEDEYGLYALEEGKKYIKVSFIYENNDDSDKYVSIYDYDCYADGTLCEQTYYFGGDFINANLSTGRNVSFDTYYVVPSNAGQIELEYTTNVWTDEKVIVKIQ